MDCVKPLLMVILEIKERKMKKIFLAFLVCCVTSLSYGSDASVSTNEEGQIAQIQTKEEASIESINHAEPNVTACCCATCATIVAGCFVFELPGADFCDWLMDTFCCCCEPAQGN